MRCNRRREWCLLCAMLPRHISTFKYLIDCCTLALLPCVANALAAGVITFFDFDALRARYTFQSTEEM